MKKFLALILAATSLCGCKTALVYTGSVKAADNERAVDVSKVLEREYEKQGLRQEKDLAQREYYYSSSWGKRGLWAGNWVKDGVVYIRIVPQPYCNDISHDLGEHMRAFMGQSVTNRQWALIPRSELDWFR